MQLRLANILNANILGMKMELIASRVLYGKSRFLLRHLIQMFREISCSCTLICLRNLIISDLFLVYAHRDHPALLLSSDRLSLKHRYSTKITFDYSFLRVLKKLEKVSLLGLPLISDTFQCVYKFVQHLVIPENGSPP